MQSKLIFVTETGPALCEVLTYLYVHMYNETFFKRNLDIT